MGRGIRKGRKGLIGSLAKKMIRPLFFIALGSLGFLFPGVSLAADHFVFIPAPGTSNYAGVTYHTLGSNSISVSIQARAGASTTPDGGFTDSVTVGLFDSATGQPSDTNAVFTDNFGNSVVGTGPLAFSSGTLSFSVTFKLGSDSEYVSIYDGGDSTSASYPGSPGPGIGYIVQGFYTNYYTADANGDSQSAPYSPGPSFSGDLLVNPNSSASTQNIGWVTVPTPSGVVGNTGIDYAAASYAVTGINAGYAFGGALPDINLFFKETVSNAGAAPLSFQVIFDYSGALTDYNNPDTSQDTVYQGSEADISSTTLYKSTNTSSGFSYLAGPSVLNKSMQNGQVILRVWGSQASNPVSMRYENPQPILGNLSQVDIPYSNLNALPVTAAISPGVALDNTNFTLTYSLTNQYNSPVSYITFQVPAGWTVNSVTTGASGVTPSVLTAPTGSAPGTIAVNTGTNFSIATGSTVTLSLSVKSPNLSFTGWTFPILSALTSLNLTAPFTPSGPFINTLAPPPAPANFTAAPVSINQGGNAVSLNWDPVLSESVTAYVVTRTEPGGPFPVTQAGTFYVDSSAANQTAYHYTVESQNAVADSGTSPAGPVTPYANPGPPTNVQALTGGSSVLLSWATPVPVSGTYPSGGYQIYKDTSPSFPSPTTISIAPGTLTYNDTGLSSATDYYYKITAIDNQYVTGTAALGPHISDYSAPVTGFPPGFPPTGITAILTSTIPDTLTVSWTAPTGNQGSPTNYYLYRGVNGLPVTTGVPFQSLGNVTTYDDQAISSGNSYQYQVAAIYPGPVTTNFSNIALGSVGPPAPTGLTALPAATLVNLSWSTEAAVTEYVLYRDSTPILFVATPTTSLTDTTASADVTLTYQVAAVDSTGVTGSLSTAVTTALLPQTPSGLTVLADGTTPSQADLSWSPSSESLLAGYELYRGTSTAFPPAGSVTTDLGDVSSRNDPGLTPGTIYYYFLKEKNKFNYLGAAATVGLRAPPSIPTGLGFTSTSSSIAVTWNANSASDNVNGYTLYRATGAGAFSVIATPPPSGALPITYVDSAAAPGVDYRYYVTATNPGLAGPPLVGGENSLASVTITAGRLPQIPPTLTASVDNTNTATLNWSAVNGTDPNAQSVSVLAGGTPVASVLPSATTYADPSLNPDTVYNFSIETNNAYGTGSPSSPPATILTYPAAPTISSLTEASNGSVLLTWSVGQTHVTGYTVYRQKGSGAISPLAPVPGAGPSFPVTLSFTTQPGQNYTYYVSASNPTGESPLSTGLSLSQPPSIPGGTHRSFRDQRLRDPGELVLVREQRHRRRDGLQRLPIRHPEPDWFLCLGRSWIDRNHLFRFPVKWSDGLFLSGKSRSERRGKPFEYQQRGGGHRLCPAQHPGPALADSRG